MHMVTNILATSVRILYFRHILRQHIRDFNMLLLNSMSFLRRRLRRSVTLIFTFLLILFSRQVVRT